KSMINKVAYFAYGSNMSISRLHKPERAPSAIVIGPAKLVDWRFVCNKQSKDGSAKANIMRSPGDTVWGVLYEINSSELQNLDNAEKGYDRRCLNIVDCENNEVVAKTYISEETTSDTRPYTWYKQLIVQGAREHCLPVSYIEFLERIESKPDKAEHS
ncbi:MAG: gamma-glutamylcyclotransferase family protein, partial [Dehalococcoidia bacterium]|nr:gamma-glutamylcyclotransferase family protein [Dehalococcoidia bacterium]